MLQVASRTVGAPPASNRIASSNEIFAIVRTLREAGLDRAHWERALYAISRSTRSQCALVGTIKFGSGDATLTPAARVGFSGSSVRAVETAANSLRSLPIGELTQTTTLIQHARPGALTDVISIKLLDKNQGYLAFAACRIGKHYREAELRFFQCLATPLCRLVASLEASRLKRMRAEALEATLDALAAGLFLIDREGRVLYANPAAERVLKSMVGLCLRGQRLTSSNRLSAACLSNAIRQATNGKEQKTATNRLSLILRGPEGKDLLVTVVALKGAETSEILNDVIAAVFVRDPDLEPTIPGEGFAKLYNLTSCELSLLLAMLPGLCLKEAAAAQGVSEATARTHLHHIFMKTGTNKQTELMRLFSSYALPILSEPNAGPRSS